MTLALSGKSSKRLSSLGLLATVVVAVAMMAGATQTNSVMATPVTTTLVHDTFTGPDAEPVGDGYTETELGGGDCKRISNHADLQRDCTMSKGVDTSGYQDIILSFRCHGNVDADNDVDFLDVYADFDGDGTFAPSEKVGSFETGNNEAPENSVACPNNAVKTWANFTINLFELNSSANDNANMGILFTTNGNHTEEAGVDDVKITGVRTVGTINIVKDAQPNRAQDFSFSGTNGLGAFTLDDDSDETLSNTQTFSDKQPGLYTVTETVPAGWELTAVTCTGGSTSAVTNGAAITLLAGETITCTFVNVLLTGEIRVKKVWVGGSGENTFVNIGTSIAPSDQQGADGYFNIPGVVTTAPNAAASAVQTVPATANGITYYVSEEVVDDQGTSRFPGFAPPVLKCTLEGGGTTSYALTELSGMFTTFPQITIAYAAIVVKTDESWVCTFTNQASTTTPTTRTVRVIKVADGDPPPASQTFGGAVGAQSWSKIDAGAATDNTGLPTTSLSVTETTVPTNWSLDGFWVGAGLLLNCDTASGYSGTSATVPAGTIPYTVCVKNTYTALKDLSVSKAPSIASVVSTGTFSWDLTVSNTGAGDATFTDGITILSDDLPTSGTGLLAYGAVSVGSVADVMNSDNIDCSVNASTLTCAASGATVTLDATTGTFKVSVAVTVDRNYLDNATSPMANPPATGSCSVDPNGSLTETNEDNNECSSSVIVTPPTDRLITVCKKLDANLDDDVDGGNFKFNVSNTVQTVAAFEFDQTVRCSSPVSVPKDISVVVSETNHRPSDWNGDAAGYPTTPVTFTNKAIPDPIILIIKNNPLGDANDDFAIDVSSATNGVETTFSLAHGQDDFGTFDPGTYKVIEQEASGFGRGYLNPEYVAIHNGDVECPSSPALSPTAPEQTLAAGDRWLVCVYNTPAEIPTVTKEGGPYVNGSATWIITIDNGFAAGGTGYITRSVGILETVSASSVPDDCFWINGAGGECQLDPGTIVSITVSDPVGRKCESGVALNSAFASVIGHTGIIFPAIVDIEAVVPANPDLCDNPILTKEAVSYQLGDGVAKWRVTIDNEVPDAGDREVVVTDPGVNLPDLPAGCAGTIATGLTCDVGAGETLEFVVEQVVTEACSGLTASNAATGMINLEVGGTEPLQGSPTGTSDVIVPANSRLCDSTVTVTKQFDDNEDGAIDAGDSFVSGWGMTLACNIQNAQDDVIIEGSTGADGSVVFVVPGPGVAPDHECVVTEDTQASTLVVGGSLNAGSFVEGHTSFAFSLIGGDSATVEFLNDPTEVAAVSTPPSDVSTPAPDTPLPEQTRPPEEQDEGTPEVTETPEPTGKPADTPEQQVGETTPVAPDSGTGTTPTSGTGAFLLLLTAVLIAFGAAHGAYELSRHSH